MSLLITEEKQYSYFQDMGIAHHLERYLGFTKDGQ